MDVEKARVTGRAERLNAQAASFLTGWTNDVPERLFHGALVSRARMKTSEDEQLRSTRDPRLFYIHSRWVDEAAFDHHAGLPHTVRFIERVQALIDHPLDVTRTRLVG